MKGKILGVLVVLPMFCAVSIGFGDLEKESSDNHTVAMESAFAPNETEGITETIEAPAAPEQVVPEPVAPDQADPVPAAPEQVAQATAVDPNSAAAANIVWASIGHEDIMLYPVEEDANNTNAQVACGYINGYIVKPGEIFSYANTIGKGTPPERGYVIAHVVGGYDYGGGVCKISSALYHAATNAGCKIIERHNHSQPVDYYAPGDDAAIAYKSRKDFRFRNDFGYDIMIQASYDETGYHLDILAPQL
ncbi:VanW like protein [Butyrivibrio proteoclasticus]|uniref:VanW like protein n=1 Tax=Butyrivibrio proteoclasticus TaxID=43305 RepID=A0A1I5XW73_9FIRM|nr:VanW family protein [Butyrivibrio proteoclasticus]SFQ36175.1 VanW like protein [Butyrivibrio proteoclasticus]